ncbi:hypothetical protein GCM10009710_00810 [Aeromicrobium alkaliterrae]|uniref:RNA polymerase sigma factor 70 region 4 type 2 domain-containing protein n=1 Tax=Aeromicrobium alkaliterrae TaxID=302168 RepID=A0ABP4VHN3_9ACTN
MSPTLWVRLDRGVWWVDEPSFEAFFHLMFPRLSRYAQRRVDPMAAEDLAAAALETIWNKDVDTPADDVAHRKLQSLAYRVLEGHLRNGVRGAARRSRVVEAVADEVLARPHDPDVAEVVTTDSWPEWAESLSYSDRDVLELVVDGYRVSEIAIILDCSPGAVTMRLRRAKRNARLLFDRRVGTHDDS